MLTGEGEDAGCPSADLSEKPFWITWTPAPGGAVFVHTPGTRSDLNFFLDFEIFMFT